ncbi:alpha/beta hydrolase [Mycobacterium sp. 852013-51886_SCH5428379]|uniref:alpha/beta hydrolase n=1 Tax=Mycobacterium sp. 852013-51886_SCH5428379 TaxID=1834111 RepID=UPI0007FFBE7D|nr:alpha/beta hydrolase [Mycobacterium sp. 852013-51886_SCH5428379]OBB57127.1 alpha/beta hydrolase [Mycobacterium sp. 852013-51886_SCH5428379]
MALSIDPEIATVLGALVGPDPAPSPAPGDVATRRTNSTVLFRTMAAARSAVDGVAVDDYTLTTDDGAELPLRWYRPTGTAMPGSAWLYVHGGGMILGMEHVGVLYDVVVREYVAASGVPALTVDYRVAPEHPDPTPVEDCYAALKWLAEQAGTLGVDPDRIAVGGDSAGGGLTAGVALLARDRGGPSIALQLLIYPMLDDRTTHPDPQLPPELLFWNYDDNITGWSALLGDRAGGPDVSPYAAPARMADLTGLPPTYIDTGDLDIFRDEDVEFARRLAAAGVPTELHVHPGCPHGFETVAPDAAVSIRTIADRIRRLRSF